MTSAGSTVARAAPRATYPFHHGRETVIAYPVTAEGVRVRVVESGSGDRIMVCLHGAGSRADRFVPAMPGLVAAGWHVYALDFPGHGFADKGEDVDYTAAGFAAVVAGVMDDLGLRSATLAGTSLGGHVAARIAVNRPELVSALVLIGSVGVSEFPDEFHTPPEILADGSEEGVRRKLNFLVAEPELVTDAWVREESMINSSAGARQALEKVAGFLDVGCNQDRQDAALRESRPDVRILLVWGEDDRWTPPLMGHAAQSALPGSELVLMPGCGHAPYFEDPDLFVDIVEKHLGAGGKENDR